jgi:four helix bundle protein
MEEAMEKQEFRTFEDLDCWKACTEVRRFIGDLVKKYPQEEKFSLAMDMKRVGRSATHNISRGFGRLQHYDNMKCCRASRGSLYELVDQLITSKDDGYISSAEYEKGRALITSALPLLNGYIGYLNKQKEQAANNKKL